MGLAKMSCRVVADTWVDGGGRVGSEECEGHVAASRHAGLLAVDWDGGLP
jgi:hypothetical protein